MRAFEYIMAFLGKVPGTFWGVVLGSLLSLAGVHLSNRAAERRQSSQLDHDREMRRQERDLSLRKDVYLAAADAMQSAVVFIGKLSNPNISLEEQSKAYFEKIPALAKVQIIGKTETIKAVLEFSSALSVSGLQLMSKRLPLDIAKNRLELLNIKATGFEKERDRWLEEMKKYNVAGKPDDRLWTSLKSNFDFEESRARDLRARIGIETLALFSQQMQFIEECVTHSQTCLSRFVPAVIAMRSELGIPTDAMVYTELVHSMSISQKAAVGEVLDHARRAVTGTGTDQSISLATVTSG